MSPNEEIKLPPEVTQRLTRRSDAKGLVQLAAHLSMLVLAGTGLQLSRDSLLLVVTLPLYGALLIFLFAPLHETIHFTAFKTRWLNNLVAAPIGFLLLIPFRYFRVFHYAHHRHTQNPELDPEDRYQTVDSPALLALPQRPADLVAESGLDLAPCRRNRR